MLQHHLLELKHSDQIEMSVMYKNTITKKRYAFGTYINNHFQLDTYTFNPTNDVITT